MRKGIEKNRIRNRESGQGIVEFALVLPVFLLVALVVVFIWGETFISTKVLITNGLMPADIFIYRFTLAYICLWAFAPKKLWCDSMKDELVMVLLGIFGGSLYFLSENTALKFSTASNVSILVCSAPLLTALLISLFYKDERMNGRQIAGSLIAFAGTFVQGASIELSADGPLRPPYTVYLQGGLTYESGKLGIMMAVSEMLG